MLTTPLCPGGTAPGLTPVCESSYATRAKYGDDVLFRHWQNWKLAHPSLNELVMIGILARLGVRSEREWRVGDSLFSVDFYLPEMRRAIEVRGKVHSVFEVEKRRRRDQAKAKLLAAAGIDCLTINYLDFCDVAEVIRRVQLFCAPPKPNGAASTR